MKQEILGTVIGRVAQKLRDRWQILRTALFKEEAAGMVANDWMATFLVTKLCRTNKVFIDVGAHIGSIISNVIYENASIKIIAIEAMPDKANNLRKKFPGIELHECAVGETDNSSVSFYVNTKLSGYSSLGKNNGNNQDIVEIQVELNKLDNIISSKNIDTIKIDVEGAELGVLRGSIEILDNSRPVIMFESAPTSDDGLGYSKEDMWTFLTSKQYEIFIPNRIAHNGAGLSLDGFIDAHLYPRRTTNYFAIPIDRRTEIRDLARKILNIKSS